MKKYEGQESYAGQMIGVIEEKKVNDWTVRNDYVIYHNKIAYGANFKDLIKLSEAIGRNNANKAYERAYDQKADKSTWKLRKHGKYEIHIK